MSITNGTAASGCPSCGEPAYTTLFRATDRLYRTTSERFNVVECSACGLIRLHPMPSPEELARFYPDDYWWDADESTSGRLAEIYRQFVLQDHVRFVARAIPHNVGLLDIGCGGGSFLNALGQRGIPVMGTDSSRVAAGITLERFGYPAVSSVLPNLPFAGGSFGAVTLFHVLEHLPHPVESLMEIHRVMVPGGKLVLQVPNAACWQLLLLGERWSGLDVPRHLINFRAEDLEGLLEYCGFAVRRRKFFSLRDNPAGLATSLAPSLEPVARRVRGMSESGAGRILRDFLYLGLVVAAVPFAALEAAALAGSTIMVEAERGDDPDVEAY